MPNRILRDWTDSDIVDGLSVYSERFFTRLIMKVDDYGRYNANVKYLKSMLFPLKTDVRETDITRWLADCKKSGLIVLYTIASKEYLQIEKFNQTLRQKNEKYPAPPLESVMNNSCVADDKHTHSTCFPETNRKESEVEKEGEQDKSASPPNLTPEQIDLFKKFDEWVLLKAPTVKKMKQPLTIDQYYKLKSVVDKEKLKNILLSMENKPDLLKKYKSAYLTIKKWSGYEWNKSESKEQNGISINEKLKSAFKQEGAN